MRKLFSLALLLLALNVEAAANKLVSTLPTTNVIWMTNYVMVVLQAGLSNQTFLVPWTNIAQQISAGQVWTNDLFLGYIRLAQFNNADFVDPLHAGATNSVSLLLYRTNVPFSYSYAASIQNNSTNNSTDGWYYENVGTYGLIAQSSPNELCMGIGIGIYTSGGSLGNMNVGLAAEADPFRSGQTNVASASFVPRKGFNSVDVGSYAEIQDPGFGADPLFETSVLLADSRDSGTPLLILRTNNGTFKAFQVNGNLTTNATPLDVASVISGYAGFTSYSSLATNAVTPTGWTNTAGVNVSGYITATAVSFTINDRSGAVLYTSPTLTATLPVSLQNGWSVQAASGLVGTILPW